MPDPAYGPDLAHVHDAGFTALAEQAAARIGELLRARGLDAAEIVELGCGSGVTARSLSAAGHRVHGIDASPAMVALARRNAPRASFAVGSFVDAPLPPCDALIAVGEVLSYLSDARAAGDDALAALFRRAHAALRPGGLLVFDLVAPGRCPPGGARGHANGDGWVVIHEAHDDGGVLTRRIATFRRTRGGLYRRSDELHRQRVERPADVLAALRAAGFRARTLRAYGDAPFAPGHAVYVARRAPVSRRA